MRARCDQQRANFSSQPLLFSSSSNLSKVPYLWWPWDYVFKISTGLAKFLDGKIQVVFMPTDGIFGFSAILGRDLCPDETDLFWPICHQHLTNLVCTLKVTQYLMPMRSRFDPPQLYLFSWGACSFTLWQPWAESQKSQTDKIEHSPYSNCPVP